MEQNWTFAGLPYARYDVDDYMRDKNAALDALDRAKTAEEAKTAFLALDALERRFYTVVSIAHIRHDCDTADPFYDAEMHYWDSNLSRTMPLDERMLKLLIAHPFRRELSEAFGPILFTEAEARVRLMDERLISDATEDQLLRTAYAKLTAECTTEYRGETCNFYGLLKFMQDPDRAVREGAFRKWAEMYAGVSDKLDGIYDKMVALRTHKAHLLGMENYIEMAYLERGRYDYTKEDVERFRAGVKRYVVPLCAKLYEQQRKRIGADKLRYYDESFFFPEGNPTPRGTEAELVAAAKEMYHRLSPETGEYFDFMTEHKLFDLTSRPGKRMGGYCTSLPDRKAPFIFSNFNGTSADVDVLTHEAGHAFQAYLASRTLPILELWQAPIEVCEIHSMSMEHFAYPYMELFFGDDAPRYRKAHLTQAMLTIPYLVMVDDFQHRVYAKPDMTREERYAAWKALEAEYLPWRDYDGDPFLEKGGFWMQKQHIFLYPFYYIDYALAQTCAFDFYLKDRADHETAWNDYLALCRAGGSVGYFDLLKIGKVRSPFDPDTVRDVTAAIEALL